MNRLRRIFYSVVVAGVSIKIAVALSPLLPSGQKYVANPKYVTERAGVDAYIEEFSKQYAAPLTNREGDVLNDSSDMSDACWLLVFESHFENCHVYVDFHT